MAKKKRPRQVQPQPQPRPALMRSEEQLDHPDYQAAWDNLSPEDKLILQSQMRRAGATASALLEHYGL